MRNSPKILQLLQEAWDKRGTGNYEEAKNLAEQAHELCTDDNYNFLGRIYHVYMQCESDKGNYAQALEQGQKSLGFYQKTQNSNKLAHSTRHLANLQMHLGHYVESELNYRKAIEIYRSRSTTRKGDLANALGGLGRLLQKMEKVEEAIQVWKEVKNLYLACNLQAGVDDANRHLQSLQ